MGAAEIRFHVHVDMFYVFRIKATFLITVCVLGFYFSGFLTKKKYYHVKKKTNPSIFDMLQKQTKKL